MITSALIFIWTGTNASIPAGWSRVTALDGYFPRVINVGDTVGATGGNSTHSHSSSGHTHSIGSHTHTFSLPAGSGYGTGDGNGGGGSQPGTQRAHTHGTTTSGAVTSDSTSSVGVTYSSYSNNPPYFEVIFISPTGDVTGIPDGAVALMDGSSLGDLTLCDGNSSTPNLLGKYLRGAATSGDAGGTGGGDTNTHTIDHTHTNTHSHVAATTAGSSANVGVNTGGSLTRNGHTHSVSLNTCSTITSNNNSAIGSQAETVLPPYTDILVGQNKTGSPLQQLGMLALYLGAEIDVPDGWSVYTKLNSLIRGSNGANAGNTGGSATHTHASQSHTHTNPTHYHATPSVGHSADVRDSSGSTAYSDTGTTHASTNSSSVQADLGSGSTTADSANNMPVYENVLLLKLEQIGPQPSVYDSSTITEYVSVKRSYEEINTSDTTTVTDMPIISIPMLHISVFDASTLTEYVPVSTSAFLIFTYETSNVTDYSNAFVPINYVYVYDSTSVSESTSLLIPTLHVNVNDASSVTDIPTTQIPTLHISVSESTTVTDFTDHTVKTGQSITARANIYKPDYVIPHGVSFMWLGTNASIPAGWERVTALDTYFIKGTAEATNPDATNVGGNATHQHTSSSHDHTMADHVHSISLPSTGGSPSANNAGSGTGFARNGHYHAAYNSGNPSSVSVGGTAVTYGSVSNNPPYIEVIFITPVTGVGTIPDQVVYFYEDSDSLAGQYVCDGNNSTPNMADKFIKGSATSGDAGSTGGSTTNVHPIDHSHTVSHQHAAASSGYADAGGVPTAVHESVVAYAHTHSVTLDANTTGTGTTEIDLTTTETVEPAYTKLLAVQNRSGGEQFRLKIIGLWINPLEDIPVNFSLLNGDGNTDMRNRYPKITTSAVSVGSTGGSNTHTHSSQSHSHGSISHYHSAPSQSHVNGSTVGDGSTYNGELNTAVHAASNTSSTNYTLNDGSTSADSSNNEPQYKTVAFIKLEFIKSVQRITAKARIMPGVQADVYDASAVTEDVVVRKDQEDLLKYETTTITESTTVVIPTLHISKFETTTVTDSSNTAKNSENAVASDSVAINESITNLIPILHVNVFDASTVTDLPSLGGRFDISAKASIKVLGVTQTISALASISILGEQTISAKASIIVTKVVTVQARASIFRKGYIDNPTFGAIVLPFPSEASIEPMWESADNITFNGTTRRAVTARKYLYKMRWNTMLVTDYDNLESVVNTLDYSSFVYEKWPQSMYGINCLGTLSPRQLVHGIGDSAYLSDVILVLTEVESRI